jgi:predicted enzyme related to lactoylglutathione lyase
MSGKLQRSTVTCSAGISTTQAASGPASTPQTVTSAAPGSLITEPGLLPYIYVDNVEETIARILEHGGEIVTNPFPEGLLTVATFRYPAGNTIGLWHDTTR